MSKLFVYGTLLASSVQREVIGREIPGTADYLPGYKKSQISIDGKIYPILARDDNSNPILGMVLELTMDEIKRTDEYEGSAYVRQFEKLLSGETAWVYVRA